MKLCDDLRQAVLQAAVTGRLVSNMNKEQPVHVESDADCGDRLNIPYDNWKFAYLKDVCTGIYDCPHSTPKYTNHDEGFRCLRTRELKVGRIEWEKLLYITKETYADRTQRYIPQYGDIVYAREGKFGVCAIIDRKMPIALGQRLMVFSVDHHIISSQFLFYVLISSVCMEQANEFQQGMTALHVNVKDVKRLLIPLPPLAEQQRIVAKVDVLMAQIDDLEQTESALTTLKEQFPKDMNAALLQAAIQGKLTDQRASDGDAADLLATIEQEKQQLIKDKKIKKEKALPAITDDEIPFDIPENWVWARFQDIAVLNPRNTVDDDISVSFIPMTYVGDGSSNTFKFDQRKWGEVKRGYTHIAEGDIGFAKITPCFQNRKSAVFKGLLNGYGAGTTELNIIRPIPHTLCPEYILAFVKSPYFINNGIVRFSGTAGQQRIDKQYFPNCLVPLPPLAEQHRIVAKLDRLLPLCDDLATLSAE